MRPEYIDAVDAVRNGNSLWLPFLPAILIWYATIRWKHGVIMFFIAWGCSWFLLVQHSNAIQAAKDTQKQTEEEFEDWSSDTWNTFASVTAVPYSLIYCLLHAAVACTVIGAGRGTFRLPHRRPVSGGKSDHESYHSTLVREYDDNRETK